MNHKTCPMVATDNRASPRSLWNQTVRKNMGAHDRIPPDPAISRHVTKRVRRQSFPKHNISAKLMKTCIRQIMISAWIGTQGPPSYSSLGDWTSMLHPWRVCSACTWPKQAAWSARDQAPSSGWCLCPCCPQRSSYVGRGTSMRASMHCVASVSTSAWEQLCHASSLGASWSATKTCWSEDLLPARSGIRRRLPDREARDGHRKMAATDGSGQKDPQKIRITRTLLFL
jgi:hypothetical protein